MRLILIATTLTVSMFAIPASARIILSETNCDEGQHIALVTDEVYDFADSGICVPVAEPPYQIRFKDGRIEGFNNKIEYEQRRDALEESVEG